MCDQVYLSKSTRPLRAAVLHTDGQKLFGKKRRKERDKQDFGSIERIYFSNQTTRTLPSG